jgi:hypothetical protein
MRARSGGYHQSVYARPDRGRRARAGANPRHSLLVGPPVHRRSPAATGGPTSAYSLASGGDALDGR